MKSQQAFERTYSVEFFPPKTEKGVANLAEVQADLAKRKPRFFSVTYGAGGSTQERTFETVVDIQKRTGVPAAPHLSCIGSTRTETKAILDNYIANDIRHVVALRGDLPSGMRDTGELKYANELVQFIREETGDHFFIEVAAYPEFHPQASNAETDIANFKRKVDAGANSAITQYFYNIDSYFYFVDRCEQLGINTPIVPGIMPILNFAQLARFSDTCGAEIPRWLRWKLSELEADPASMQAFATDFIIGMCEKLLDAGAPGLHFYSMNKTNPTAIIWDKLGLG